MTRDKALELLKTGVELYYTGDAANKPSYGVIISITRSEIRGTQYMIRLKEFTTQIGAYEVGDDYSDQNHGKRFFLKSAYEEYRRVSHENQMAALRGEMA